MIVNYLKQGIQGLNTGGFRELSVGVGDKTFSVKKGAHLANNDEILVCPLEGKKQTFIAVKSIDCLETERFK